MTTHLNVTTHSFSDGHAQAVALAERIAERLRMRWPNAAALLAVSGGSTPKDFFARLSRETLDWANVQVTLVDERWVPDTDERSNAQLVKSLLLQHAASSRAVRAAVHRRGRRPRQGWPRPPHASTRCRCRSTRWCSAWATMAIPPRSFPAAIIWPRRWIWTAMRACCRCTHPAPANRASRSACPTLLDTARAVPADRRARRSATCSPMCGWAWMPRGLSGARRADPAARAGGGVLVPVIAHRKSLPH